MADERNPKDPTYDWLYSGKDGEQGPPPPEAEPSGPPPSEETQQFPPPDPAPPADDNATKVFGVPPRDSGQQPPAPAGSEKRPSFGGTYDAPPPRSTETRSEPRFATPASTSQRPAPPGRPPAQPKTKPPRRPGGRRKWWIRGIVALVVAWIVFLVAVPLWAYSQISKVDAEPSGERPEDTPGTTYLLVGSDSREGLSQEERKELGTGRAEGQRTDTIMLLHVPDGDGPNLLLSLPRDSYVEIPGRGENKINAAYSFGGPELLVATVEQNTNLRVDNYIEVGFTGFVDAVDAVGGIEVCPKTRINDPKAGGIKMDKGCQDIDGNTALQYSRSRAFGNGDITRALHQREVIAAVGQQATSWQTVVLPWRYFKVNKAGADSLRIGEDTGLIDLGRFAWAMAHSSGPDAKRCVVPFTSLGAPTPAGAAVIWDEQKAMALFEQVAADDTESIDCLGE